jgi:hypothetical protein
MHQHPVEPPKRTYIHCTALHCNQRYLDMWWERRAHGHGDGTGTRKDGNEPGANACTGTCTCLQDGGHKLLNEALLLQQGGPEGVHQVDDEALDVGAVMVLVRHDHHVPIPQALLHLLRGLVPAHMAPRHTFTLSHSHTLTLSHSHTLTLSHSHTSSLEHSDTQSTHVLEGQRRRAEGASDSKGARMHTHTQSTTTTRQHPHRMP